MDLMIISKDFTPQKVRTNSQNYNIDKEDQEIFTRNFKHVFFLMRSCGLIPISWTTKGPAFQLFSVPTAYCLIIYLIILSLTGIEIHRLGGYLIEHRYQFNKFLFTLVMLVFYTSSAILVPLQWLKTKQIIVHVYEWIDINIYLNNLKRKSLKKRKSTMNFIISFAIMALLLLILFFTFNNIWKILRIWELFFLWFQLLSIHTFLLFWVLVTKAMKQFAKNLREYYIEVLDVVDEDLHTDYRQLWIKLNQWTNDMCGQFCYTLGFLILNFFIVIIILAYTSFLFFKLNYSRFFIFGLTSFYIYMQIYTICVLGDDAVKEIGETFKTKLFEIYEEKPPLAQKEIIRFVKMINEDPPKLNFLGYTSVDRMLLLRLTSTMISYLIVLFQLKLGKDISDKNSFEEIEKELN